ncbi:MAG: spore maturation protein [Deltaproteobacteria bacterium]|nr:spore maturation protein [Deltaproteobacteria bacterium]
MKQKASAINVIWLVMILMATVTAAFNGKMAAVTAESFNAAKNAVTLAITLIGAMALWLGIMKVVEVAGLMKIIAAWLRPVMIRLFPDVPHDHPAMSAIIMNFAANVLGLANAATPMGIKAMQQLDKLNPEKGTATNAMCLFLAMNTSSVTLLPLGVIAVRAAAGASNPSSIILTTILATICSTLTAIIAAKLLASRHKTLPADLKQTLSLEAKADPADPEQIAAEETGRASLTQKILVLFFVAVFLVAIVCRIYQGNLPVFLSASFFSSLSNWMIPVLMCSLLVFGYLKGVRVYETLTEGARDGFDVAVKIIPFMVAIFVAIGMFRASGALEMVVSILNPVTALFGMPAEALSVALMRPLSGSGSFAIMSEVINRDPDSFLSYLVSTMQGSTETTFYVLAVYFGSIGITKTRYALPAALCADAAGLLSSVLFCRIFF